LLGTYLLDRGQPVMAALCFERLLAKPANEGKPAPLMLLKAAVAFRRTGDVNRRRPSLGNGSPSSALAALTSAAAPSPSTTSNTNSTASPTRPSPSVSTTGPWSTAAPAARRTARAAPPSSTRTAGCSRRSCRIRTRQWVEQAVAYQEKRGNHAVLPGFFPIAAGGKLIFRSYSGVQAADLRTGKLVWEQPANWSLDKLVADGRKLAALRNWIGTYGQGGSQHVVYENSTVGSLSTDHTLVYAVDDLALPPHPNFCRIFNGAANRTSWS